MSRTWQENAGLLALRAGMGGVLVAHGLATPVAGAARAAQQPSAWAADDTSVEPR
jgi:hypothetical protein